MTCVVGLTTEPKRLVEVRKNRMNTLKETELTDYTNLEKILKEVEEKGLDGNNQLYITFATNNSKTSVPNWLLQKYPNEMTIVIQHEYYHLLVDKKNFNIGLSFNNKKCDLKISIDSIISFVHT